MSCLWHFFLLFLAVHANAPTSSRGNDPILVLLKEDESSVVTYYVQPEGDLHIKCRREGWNGTDELTWIFHDEATANSAEESSDEINLELKNVAKNLGNYSCTDSVNVITTLVIRSREELDENTKCSEEVHKSLCPKVKSCYGDAGEEFCVCSSGFVGTTCPVKQITEMPTHFIYLAIAIGFGIVLTIAIIFCYWDNCRKKKNGYIAGEQPKH